jgi:ActR/RegA family two-component response regulator
LLLAATVTEDELADRRPVILVVDHDRRSLRRVARLLERRDYAVLAAADDLSGMEELRSIEARGDQLALALADLGRPYSRGVDLLATDAMHAADLRQLESRGLHH